MKTLKSQNAFPPESKSVKENIVEDNNTNQIYKGSIYAADISRSLAVSLFVVFLLKITPPKPAFEPQDQARSRQDVQTHQGPGRARKPTFALAIPHFHPICQIPFCKVKNMFTRVYEGH